MTKAEQSAFVKGQWRTLDRILMLLNSMTSDEARNPDAMRRHIYGEVHAMRPEAQ